MPRRRRRRRQMIRGRFSNRRTIPHESPIRGWRNEASNRMQFPPEPLSGIRGSILSDLSTAEQEPGQSLYARSRDEQPACGRLGPKPRFVEALPRSRDVKFVEVCTAEGARSNAAARQFNDFPPPTGTGIPARHSAAVEVRNPQPPLRIDGHAVRPAVVAREPHHATTIGNPACFGIEVVCRHL